VNVARKTAMSNKSPFEIINLTTSATTQEVKSSWRRLASIHHPDKGGDAEKFNELRQAYNAALKLAEANDIANSKCPTCEGSGKVVNPRQRGFYADLKMMCPNCMGSGEKERGR
jgi:DnaJ-class molecular chaperone